MCSPVDAGDEADKGLYQDYAPYVFLPCDVHTGVAGEDDGAEAVGGTRIHPGDGYEGGDDGGDVGDDQRVETRAEEPEGTEVGEQVEDVAVVERIAEGADDADAMAVAYGRQEGVAADAREGEENVGDVCLIFHSGCVLCCLLCDGHCAQRCRIAGRGS